MRFAAVLLALTLLLGAALAEPDAEQDDWWNILLLGGDSRSSEQYDRTDSIIILSVNRQSGALKMTSVMRDTWVSFPGRESKGKINAANVYGGPELAMATVNASFGTQIEDYVLVNMTGLVKVVDALDGVDIKITSAELKYLNEYARDFANTIGYEGDARLAGAGMAHLNGLLALSYARIRYADSDYQRAMRQQTVLLALAKKASALSAPELLKLVPKLLGMTDTNLSMGAVRRPGHGRNPAVPHSRRRHVPVRHVRRNLVHQAGFRGKRPAAARLHL